MKQEKQQNSYGEVFSRIYNEMGWNYYPEYFGEQLLTWLGLKGVHPKTALDLGCGTGVLCEILTAHGIAAQGVDLSESMIRIARQRNSEIPYTIGDMTTFLPDHVPCFDLVTSTCDALNHLHREEQIRQVFQNVYTYLNPGGYFIFDLLNEEEKIDETPCEFDYSEQEHIRIQTVLTPERVIEMTVSCQNGEKLLWEEVVAEKLYPWKKIWEMLQETGFSQIRCAESLLPTEQTRCSTLYFIVRKRDTVFSSG